MSNNPGGAADLGSAYSTIGFIVDRNGFTQYVRDANAILQIQQRVTQQHQGQAAASQQATASQRSQTGATQSLANLTDQLHRAQLRASLAQSDGAGKVRLLAAEYIRLEARTREAGLAQDELTRRQIAAANAQTRLVQAQNARDRGLGPALPRTFAGFTGGGALQAAGALGLATSTAEVVGQFKQMADEGLRVQATLDSTRSSLSALVGDQQRGNETFERAIATGRELGFTQRDTAEAIRASSLIIRESQSPIEEIFNVLARLQVLSPEQGLSGAALAIKELAAGDIVSLRERFEVSASSANKLKKEIQGGGDAVQVLGKYLDEIGINDGALEANLSGAAGQQREYNQAIEDLQLRLNELVTSTGWREFQSLLIRDLTTSIGGGAGDLDKIINDLVRASGSAEEFRQRRDAIIRAGSISPDAGTAITAARLQFTPIDYDAIKASQLSKVVITQEAAALDDLQRAQENVQRTQNAVTHSTTAYTDAVQDQLRHTQEFTANLGLLALQQGRLAGESQGRASTARQQAQARIANQRELEDAIIDANDNIEQANEQRIDRLGDLEEAHTEKVADLQQRLVDINTDAQEQIADTVAEGVERRAELEQDLAERVADFISSHAQQTARQREDQERADRRSAEDFAEDQQDALEDYQERRSELLEQQRDADVRDEEEYQRELLRSQREGEVERERSNASFLEQLYDLTRGRRTKAEREEARAALAAAQAEAAELARTDPEAAAALLAERQRQILAGIQRRRENSQLRRDARRGGGLGSTDAEAEIGEIERVTQEADQATIDAIKAGAAERAEDRERQKEERAGANQEALDDLDQGYADQKAERERQRAEQLREQEEDRRFDTERRNADYAAQLAELQRSGAEQLAEFDRNQAKRIQQIRDHAAEQVQATKDQLADVDAEYVAARQKVSDDYDAFITDLQTKLRDSANSLDLLPDEQRRQQLKDAYALLATELGAAFNGALQGAINIPGTTVPGAAPRNAGVSGAARAVTAGGRIISDFGDDRTGVGGTGRRSHQGIDIAGKYGAPIHSLTDGIVEFSGWNTLGGWCVQILDDSTGMSYYYAHMAEASPLQVGMRVRAGQVIGRVGTSGDAAGTEPHVHVQIGRKGDWVDPASVLAGYNAPQQASGAAQGGQQARSSSRQKYSAQAQRQGDLYGLPMDRPRMELPRISSPPIAIDASTTVDLTGAYFGPGVSMSDVEAAVRRGVSVQSSLDWAAIQRQLEMAATQGQYR